MWKCKFRKFWKSYRLFINLFFLNKFEFISNYFESRQKLFLGKIYRQILVNIKYFSLRETVSNRIEKVISLIKDETILDFSLFSSLFKLVIFLLLKSPKSKHCIHITFASVSSSLVSNLFFRKSLTLLRQTKHLLKGADSSTISTSNSDFWPRGMFLTCNSGCSRKDCFIFTKSWIPSIR